MSSTIPEIEPAGSAAEILSSGIQSAGGTVSLACSFSMEKKKQEGYF
jgi:hypothetical protein